MKKILIILSVLVAFSLAGVLYATQGESDDRKTVTLEQVYESQCPAPMSGVIFSPYNITF